MGSSSLHKHHTSRWSTSKCLSSVSLHSPGPAGLASEGWITSQSYSNSQGCIWLFVFRSFTDEVRWLTTQIFTCQPIVLIGWAELRVFWSPHTNGRKLCCFSAHTRAQPALGAGRTQPTSLAKHVLLIFLHHDRACIFCALAELWACSPGTITSHFCETPWGQILPLSRME